MDIATKIVQSFVIPFYHRRWGLYDPILRRRLEESQYLPPELIRQSQWEAVRTIVGFAADHSPFYRQRFRDIGFTPDDLKDWSDYEALPVLTKDDVRDHLDSMISKGYSKDTLFHKRTGGSTGVPVHLYWDEAARRHKNASGARHDSWSGYGLGMKRAALWGDTDKRRPLKDRFYRALCERTIYLDTLKMESLYMRDFIRQMREFDPYLLIGHAHSLYFFTEFLLREEIDDVNVGAIISTAEALSPEERSVVESYFGRIVFDRYGCEELSLIASECEAHDGLHTNADGLCVEVLDEYGSAPGRLVITDLVNRGMPFIRYEIGDLATSAQGPCPCGRGLPRLRRVYGRTSDILYAPDGRRISGISILDTFMIHVPGVRQAQIVQDRLDHVKLFVVPDRDFSEETFARLQQAVLEIFGARMTHDVQQIDRIEPTARGKYQFSVCQIPPPDEMQGAPSSPEDTRG